VNTSVCFTFTAMHNKCGSVRKGPNLEAICKLFNLSLAVRATSVRRLEAVDHCLENNRTIKIDFPWLQSLLLKLDEY
jgi:hypothetical protein